MSLERLSGRFALVTGGGSGIGRAICQVFAREGASVAVVDVNAAGIEETLKLLPRNRGNKHCSIQADVTSENQAEKAVKEAEEKLGQKCTILVNSAGVHRQIYLAEMTGKLIDETMNVNLKGLLLMSKHFLLSLTEEGKEFPGQIVNIASLSSRVCSVGEAVYAASKFGVVAATKTTALEYGKHQIRCNAVMPGSIVTPMFYTIAPEITAQREKKTPLGRHGQPEDVANACLFLVTDESSFITGTTLEVTGGLCI